MLIVILQVRVGLRDLLYTSSKRDLTVHICIHLGYGPDLVKVTLSSQPNYSLFTIRWHMTVFSLLLNKTVILHLRLNKLLTRCEMYVQLELTTIMSNALQLDVYVFSYYIWRGHVPSWTIDRYRSDKSHYISAFRMSV